MDKNNEIGTTYEKINTNAAGVFHKINKIVKISATLKQEKNNYKNESPLIVFHKHE